MFYKGGGGNKGTGKGGGYAAKGYGAKGKGYGGGYGYGGEYKTSGLPICYFDQYTRLFKTNCVDPYDPITLMSAESWNYSCGCCSPYVEYGGKPLAYCYA